MLLFVASCGRLGADAGSNGDASGAGSLRIIPRSDRGAPVVLTGTDLSGASVTLSGRPHAATIVNVWWSGCVECRVEASTLRALASDQSLKSRLLGIDVRESSPIQGRRFVEKYGLLYPSLYDPGGRALLAFGGAVPYMAIPTTVVLDEGLRVGAVVLGVLPPVATMRTVIAEVLSTGP
ncbi:MAG: TlpA disulfide reductase family protein [Marmoricola sp.]